MSNDHHNVADAATATAVDTNAMDVARHAESHTRPQHGSAAGFDPPAAAPPGLDAGMGAPPRAHDPGPRRRARTVSPRRDTSRSPRSSAATPGGTGVPVPDSPSWHDAKPGPNCSAEELRFWSIREIGTLHETARLSGSHIHGLLKEVKALRSMVEPKAEATAVASELDRLREDCVKEFGMFRKEFDKSDLENAVGRLADSHKELAEQTQAAFRQVGAVEASLQGHVSQGFTEAV